MVWRAVTVSRKMLSLNTSQEISVFPCCSLSGSVVVLFSLITCKIHIASDFIQTKRGIFTPSEPVTRRRTSHLLMCISEKSVFVTLAIYGQVLKKTTSRERQTFLVIAIFRFCTISIVIFLWMAKTKILLHGNHAIQNGIHVFAYCLLTTRLQLSLTHWAFKAVSTLRYLRHDTPIIFDEDYWCQQWNVDVSMLSIGPVSQRLQLQGNPPIPTALYSTVSLSCSQRLLISHNKASWTSSTCLSLQKWRFLHIFITLIGSKSRAWARRLITRALDFVPLNLSAVGCEKIRPQDWRWAFWQCWLFI